MSVERDRIGHEESQPRDPKHFTLNLCLILRASLLPLAKYYITLCYLHQLTLLRYTKD